MATYVLVHGSYQGGWIWQPVANRLRAAGHQVYAPSLDGCGERKGQMRPGITTETQADEVSTDVQNWTLYDIENWTPGLGFCCARLDAGVACPGSA